MKDLHLPNQSLDIVSRLQADIENLIVTCNQVYCIGQSCYHLQWLSGQINDRIYSTIIDLGVVIQEAERIASMLKTERAS